MLIEYVGLKPQETDCLAGTGKTWYGAGDVQEVPDSAWAIMSKHPDMWKRIEGDSRPKVESDSTPAAKITVTDATGRTATLVLVDGAYALPAGLVLADAPKAPGLGDSKPAKFALQGPDGTIVLDGKTDAELAKLAEELGVDIDLRKKGDGRRAAILDAVEAADAKA
jgi:hypothetical protein